jgi:23S rRNA-/tRNA-specific pseudouridylate synthase
VFPPHDDPGGDCLVARILAEDPDRARVAWPEGFEAGVVHRLDTGTSGAVALADDLDDLERLRELFRAHRLVKTYRLVVARDPRWDENRCDRSIAHDPRHKGRMVVQRGPSTPHRGRWLPADTSFRRIEGTLFEATMSTGVTHQIRVHAAFLGIPLAGDRRYGGGDDPAGFRLHHVGFAGGGVASAPVPWPEWARPRSESRDSA